MIQKIRGTITLVRVQSVPVTAVSLALGYATITGTVITEDILPLVAVGALGHMGFYGLNDVMDYRWDVVQGRGGKPLVARDISRSWASFITSVLVVFSIMGAYEYFPPSAFLFWLSASALGFVYNVRSKKDTYAGVYLGIWGAVIILIGSSYAGSINGLTVILALLLGVHMFWMTIMGNMKDIETGEESIPNKLGCRIVSEDYDKLYMSPRLAMFTSFVILAEVVLLLLLPIGDGLQYLDPVFIYLAIISSVAIMVTSDRVIYIQEFDRDNMKKNIALHEVVTVVSVVVVGLSFYGAMSALVMLAGSIAWGLIWQTVLYGHPLRFP